MKKFAAEFKEFIMRGNVMDMAVGVIVATAFGKITTSLVNDLFMPFISWLFGTRDMSALNLVARPEVVENGRCTNSVAHGWAPVGVHQINITLQPGESRSLIFILGYIENPENEKWAAPGVINKTRAHAMMERYATDTQIDAARAALRVQANDALAANLKRHAADTLDKVLFELSSQMKNAYSRSDA